MGEREQWRRTLLAAMANYIDAGSIVAGAVALPIWAKHFGFGDSFVSFLGAFSSNAIAAGLGALIGGRVCDLLGRKKIYQWDLLMYAFGTLWIIFATQEWMLLIGFFIVGLTVGADVPASWTLITETAPNEKRGRFAGLAQVLWYVGAIAPLILGIALLDLGMLATRIIFAHLLVVALITWALRQRMTESAMWEKAQKQRDTGQAIKQLLSRRHAAALAFLIAMYGIWNLVAGTYGIFFPYILDAVGSTSDRATLALQAIWFISTALAVGFVYMPLIDRVNRARAAGVEHGAAAGGVRAVHLLRRHLPHLADQRRAVRRRRGDRPAVAVPALERRAVPDAAALDRPGLHVRGGADRARRLAAAARRSPTGASARCR